jgi:hypothetical protein
VPVVRIESLEQIRTMAGQILDPERIDPVVCVTIRRDDTEPMVDVEALAAAVGSLPVYVVPNGTLTWELTALLPADFDVFGGASRIWFPQLSPADDRARHPLVFCYAPYEAPDALARILRELSRWGWDLGEAAPVAAEIRPKSFTFLPAQLAPVDDDGLEDLVVGEMVEARVVDVYLSGAEVELPGGVRTTVRNRRGRTGAPSCQAGDIVSVQVLKILWASRTVEACWPLGPEAVQTGLPSPPHATTATPADLARLYVPRAKLPPIRQADEPELADFVTLREEAEDIVGQLRDELAAAREWMQEFGRALRAELDEARTEARSLRNQLTAAETDRRNAIVEMGKQRERANDIDRKYKREKDKLAHVEAQLHGLGVHDDPAEQFCHEVEVAWRRLRQAGDGAVGELHAYRLGDYFLSSLAALQGMPREQVVGKIARMLAGAMREWIHPFRVSEGGNSAQRVRPFDGAKAFRFYLQHKAPAARRLNFWELPDGVLELANVADHDDMAIH